GSGEAGEPVDPGAGHGLHRGDRSPSKRPAHREAAASADLLEEDQGQAKRQENHNNGNPFHNGLLADLSTVPACSAPAVYRRATPRRPHGRSGLVGYPPDSLGTAGR